LKNKENLVLWAGGSGITPTLSILKYCLATDKKINIQLVFCNSSQKNIMFLEELNSLETKFSNFQIKHIISHSEQNNFLIKSFKSWFLGSEADIKESQILNGRLDINKIKSLLPSGKSVHYICGPISMMEFCEKSLIELGSDPKDIHLEYFATKKENDVLYSTGQKVPKTGNYICMNCGFIQHFQKGENFTVCPVCLAGEDDPDYELWKFHE
jgi:ring-1,2-phenylacetyl-CoA epoxidase subunit PaaE